MDTVHIPEGAKRAVIAFLVKLKNIDQQESISEVGYIFHVARQLNVADDEVYRILDDPESFPLDPPKDERERVIIMYYFLFFIKSDGVIAEKEVELIRDVGFKLGFRPGLTEDLIYILKKYVNQPVPPEELLQKLRAYLN